MSDQLPPQNFPRRRFWNRVDKRDAADFLVWCDLQAEVQPLKVRTPKKVQVELDNSGKSSLYFII